jgi:hypothetical protein
MKMIAGAGMVVMVVFISYLGVFTPAKPVMAQDTRIVIPGPRGNPQPPTGWAITTQSGKAEIALAKHLSAIGVKEYGAFWCPHCYEQKQLFGQQAFALINYIECDPKGKNPQRQLCLKEEIQGFPTWKIKGKLYAGTQSLEKLAQLSGYTGATNFKYKL